MASSLSPRHMTRRSTGAVSIAILLRADKAKHEASVATRQVQAETSTAEIRRRWYLPEDEGGFPISVKRTYIRAALHAVIVYPAGQGNKKFDPDLLNPIWRTE